MSIYLPLRSFYNHQCGINRSSFKLFHSHINGTLRQGKLLTHKADSKCQLIFRNFRSNKKKSSSFEEKPSLKRHVLFTISVCGCSFTGAMIWQYESMRKLAKRFYNQQKGFFQEKQDQLRKHHFYQWVSERSQRKRVVMGIVGINIGIFLLWRVSRLEPFMKRFFLCAPGRDYSVVSGLLSAFSHTYWFHILCNMYVLWSFSGLALQTLGKEQFLALYLSGAALSSLTSNINKVFRRIKTPSIGASGAVLSIIAVCCMIHPESRVSIAFVDQIFPHSFEARSAFIGLIIFDTLGLIFKWGILDHAGHLGGSLFGAWYVTYGHNWIWHNKDKVLSVWHKIRGNPS